jgi:hypothetical protein
MHCLMHHRACRRLQRQSVERPLQLHAVWRIHGRRQVRAARRSNGWHLRASLHNGASRRLLGRRSRRLLQLHELRWDHGDRQVRRLPLGRNGECLRARLRLRPNRRLCERGRWRCLHLHGMQTWHGNGNLRPKARVVRLVLRRLRQDSLVSNSPKRRGLPIAAPHSAASLQEKILQSSAEIPSAGEA